MPQALNIPDVKSRLEQKPTDSLLDIIQYTQDDYRPEAIEVIKSILIDRGIQHSEITLAEEKYHKAFKTSKPTNYQPKQKGLHKYFMWLIYLLGIMLLLYIKKEINKSMLNTAIQYGTSK